MNWLRRFGLFWYDFVVGDDWFIAAGVVVVVALTYLVAHAGYTGWPLLLAGVSGTLALSLHRAARAYIRDQTVHRQTVHRTAPRAVNREDPSAEGLA
jgi:hypothetical protein